MNLTETLSRYEFLCGIENEVYVLDLSAKTCLIIQGNQDELGLYHYDFYKQSFYRQSQPLKFYGRNLNAERLIACVSVYFEKRRQAMYHQLEKRQAPIKYQDRRALLRELLKSNEKGQTEKQALEPLRLPLE